METVINTEKYPLNLDPEHETYKRMVDRFRSLYVRDGVVALPQIVTSWSPPWHHPGHPGQAQPGARHWHHGNHLPGQGRFELRQRPCEEPVVSGLRWEIPSKSFIWVTSKYLGSCWSYRKTKATLLCPSTIPLPMSQVIVLWEKLLLNKVEREKNRCRTFLSCIKTVKDNCKIFCSSYSQKM